VLNLIVYNVNILIAHIVLCKFQGKSKITELDDERGFLITWLEHGKVGTSKNLQNVFKSGNDIYTTGVVYTSTILRGRKVG
jgi:hypothetical protein